MAAGRFTGRKERRLKRNQISARLKYEKNPHGLNTGQASPQKTGIEVGNREVERSALSLKGGGVSLHLRLSLVGKPATEETERALGEMPKSGRNPREQGYALL